jgi:hypothetical protein
VGTADNFYCPVCDNGSTHTSMQECPNNTSMRTYGSGYKVTGAGKGCGQGCKGKPHPYSLCPKNKNSMMHPDNKKARDKKTHKESKQHDKELAGKGGCAVTILAFGGGAVVAVALVAAEIVRAL